MSKAYIGDSVYVDYQNHQLVLTTENGDGPPSNTIILEPEVWQALVGYVEQLSKASKGRHEAKLNDGTVVLGKLYNGEVTAMTYSNRTQAQGAAEREDGEVIQRGRPFYVRLKS